MSVTPGDGAEELAEPLRSRWSPASFDPDDVPDDAVVARLLQAARWAPSGGNRQPARFVVLRRGSAAHQALLPRLRRGNAGWVPTAPLVFVVVLAREDDDRPAPGPDLAAYDVGQAVAHLTLQARAEGLHAHQFAGFDHGGVAVDLGVPAPAEVVVAVAVGRHRPPAGREGALAAELAEREQRTRTRRPLAELARDGHWERPWSGSRGGADAVSPPEVG